MERQQDQVGGAHTALTQEWLLPCSPGHALDGGQCGIFIFQGYSDWVCWWKNAQCERNRGRKCTLSPLNPARTFLWYSQGSHCSHCKDRSHCSGSCCTRTFSLMLPYWAHTVCLLFSSASAFPPLSNASRAVQPTIKHKEPITSSSMVNPLCFKTTSFSCVERVHCHVLGGQMAQWLRIHLSASASASGSPVMCALGSSR